MDTASLILLISFTLAVAYVYLVAQVVSLHRSFRSRGWFLIAAGFVLIAFRQVVLGLLRIPAAIVRAQAHGMLTDRLSAEQWMGIGSAFVVVGLLIAGMEFLKKDLRGL